MLTTRRGWRYRRRETVRDTYIIYQSRTERKTENSTGRRPRKRR
uniref:Uncharacterized protein n=1 Tax=Dulem virus 34 TaxID=3145752 RepID=A0AAU8B6B5_9CAUD